LIIFLDKQCVALFYTQIVISEFFVILLQSDKK